MAVGKTDVQILGVSDTTTLANTISGLRVSNNDVWLMTAIGPENNQVCVVHIEQS